MARVYQDLQCGPIKKEGEHAHVLEDLFSNRVWASLTEYIFLRHDNDTTLFRGNLSIIGN